MDDLFRSLGHLARRHPASLPLLATGYFRAKDHRITSVYRSFNLSLILAGRGTYHYRGEVLPVVAPAVLTQWPGEANDYGPDTTWRELYFIFPSEGVEHFQRLGVVERGRPLWSVRGGPFLALAEDFLRHLIAGGAFPPVDRLDRLAELLAVESCLAAAAAPLPTQDRSVLAIREGVDDGSIADPEREARRRGMAASTFRRRWLALVGIPPARYAVEVRLREAGRRLCDTDAPVAEIARDLGFTDPLYFSRRFRAFAGMSPLAWRGRAVRQEPP